MIGPEQPLTLSPDVWKNHIEELRNWDDYPGRSSDLADAQATLARIEQVIDQTGSPPSAREVLQAHSSPLDAAP